LKGLTTNPTTGDFLMRSITGGVNNSKEGFDVCQSRKLEGSCSLYTQNGITHIFSMTFDSTEDRDHYLVHKSHQDFVGTLKPHLETVHVVDYEDGVWA
jgi:hypothetical protein